MKKVKSKCRLALIICLLLCLISGIGASGVETNFGNVHMERISWVNSLGYTISGMLFVPDTATAENPAPAVITVHGWYNTNEFQDLFNMELARRGYVVLSPDMTGHGNSEIVDWDHLYKDASGINSAVELLATQDYVDSTRIGLTGHSSGGDQSGAALTFDNEREDPLIAAILWQSSIWIDDEGVDHLAEIGSRQAGVVATQYDEFFYGDVPREFIHSEDARNFLTFSGESPIEGDPVAGEYYTCTIDGEEAARVIYTPAITHPREHFSTESVGYMLDFFDRALDAPNPIASSSQIWPVMTFFKALGLVSWIFVFITFALCMLDTKYFSSLRASGKETVVAPLPRHEGKKGLAWFWLPLIGCGLINGILFVALQSAIIQKPTIISFWPQTSSLGIGVWSAVSAVISIAVFILYYRTYGKNHGYNLKERGTLISKDKVVKTVLLALLTVLVGFAVLFGVDYFFNTDFRFYLIAARPFNSELFFIALRFLPFFLISHIVNAIVINGPFYNDIGSKRWKHGNLIIVCFFNILGMLIMWAFQYITFYVTGTKPLAANLGTLICFIWMVPLIFNLISTSVISRTIYRKSGNPYIGAIINAFLVTFVQCASTTTVFMGMSSNSYLPM